MSGESIADLPERPREIASMDRATYAATLAAMPGLPVPPRLRAETLRRLLAYEVQAQSPGGLTTSAR